LLNKTESFVAEGEGFTQFPKYCEGPLKDESLAAVEAFVEQLNENMSTTLKIKVSDRVREWMDYKNGDRIYQDEHLGIWHLQHCVSPGMVGSVVDAYLTKRPGLDPTLDLFARLEQIKDRRQDPHHVYRDNRPAHNQGSGYNPRHY
jgi:hypothetical protein